MGVFILLILFVGIVVILSKAETAEKAAIMVDMLEHMITKTMMNIPISKPELPEGRGIIFLMILQMIIIRIMPRLQMMQ